MVSLYTGIPLLYCVGCYQCVCTGPCLATHRDIYICHNTWCHFHAPPPAPPAVIDQETAQPAAPPTNNAPQTRAITASIIQNTDDATIQANLATNPEDPDVTCREVIAREWRQVGPGPNTAPGQSPTASTASVEGARSNADAQQSFSSPARFSIEEYEAQARLLERFQPRHSRQPQTGPQERSGRGPNRRPRIQIIWE